MKCEHAQQQGTVVGQISKSQKQSSTWAKSDDSRCRKMKYELCKVVKLRKMEEKRTIPLHPVKPGMPSRLIPPVGLIVASSDEIISSTVSKLSRSSTRSATLASGSLHRSPVKHNTLTTNTKTNTNYATRYWIDQVLLSSQYKGGILTLMYTKLYIWDMSAIWHKWIAQPYMESFLYVPMQLFRLVCKPWNSIEDPQGWPQFSYSDSHICFQ